MKRISSLTGLLLLASMLMGNSNAGCFGVPPNLTGLGGGSGGSTSSGGLVDATCSYPTFFATDGRVCDEFKGYQASAIEMNKVLCTTGQGAWEEGKSCDRTGVLGACRTTLVTAAVQTQWYYATATMRELRDLPCRANGTLGAVLLDAAGTVFDTDTDDNVAASCATVTVVRNSSGAVIETKTHCADYLGVWTRPMRDQEMTRVCVPSGSLISAVWSETSCSHAGYLGGCKLSSYGGYGVGSTVVNWQGGDVTVLDIKDQCERSQNVFLTP